MKSILCFGDSLIHGDFDAECGGWIDRIRQQTMLQWSNANYSRLKIYNLGIGGETTDGFKLRLLNEVMARRIKGQQLALVVGYGLNDIVIHKNKNKVPLHYFLKHIENSIDSIQSSSPQVLLCAIPPIPAHLDGVVNQHGDCRLSQDVVRYNEALATLAEKKNWLFLDIYSLIKNAELSSDHSAFSDDGVHFNTHGHQLVAQTALQNYPELWQPDSDKTTHA